MFNSKYFLVTFFNRSSRVRQCNALVKIPFVWREKRHRVRIPKIAYPFSNGANTTNTTKIRKSCKWSWKLLSYRSYSIYKCIQFISGNGITKMPKYRPIWTSTPLIIFGAPSSLSVHANNIYLFLYIFNTWHEQRFRDLTWDFVRGVSNCPLDN